MAHNYETVAKQVRQGTATPLSLVQVQPVSPVGASLGVINPILLEQGEVINRLLVQFVLGGIVACVAMKELLAC